MIPPLLGHDDVQRALTQALAQDRLHHALLLEGPEGVGKRAFADRFAQQANCEREDPAERPCGTCATCRSIAGDSHPDVVRVTPDPSRASRTIGVDAIREVVRKAGYHRYGARKRVVIVDPAESMVAAAANALLKTLEEPTPHTHFLLVTSQPRALLPTIRSRCQRVRLRPVRETRLAEWLTARGIDDAPRLARLAEGSPGRALRLAEEGVEGTHADLRALVDALGGDLGGIFAWSESMTGGKRQAWAPRVDAVLDALDELVRDAHVAACGAAIPRRHDDLTAVTDAWAEALGPRGLDGLSAATRDARTDLDRNVSGKNVLDALLTRLATTLGPARTAKP